MQSDVFDKVTGKVKSLINEIQKHLDDKNRGEILRDGYQISIIVEFF